MAHGIDGRDEVPAYGELLLEHLAHDIQGAGTHLVVDAAQVLADDAQESVNTSTPAGPYVVTDLPLACAARQRLATARGLW